MKNIDKHELTPWGKFFLDIRSEAAIKERVTVRPAPLSRLHLTPAFQVQDVVHEQLSSIFIPTSAVMQVLLYLLSRAYAHCVKTYPSTKDYVKNLYLADLPQQQQRTKLFSPICLTGDAGAGKSACIQSLSRLLPVDSKIDVGPGHEQMPLSMLWSITVDNRTSVLDILTPFFENQLKLKNRLRQSDLTRYGVKVTYRNGVCMITVDELQFLAQSSTATVLIAKTLMQLSYLGVPVTYVANESLIRKLELMWPENVQRILTQKLTLLALDPQTPEWVEYLSEVQLALGQTFSVDTEAAQNELYALTAGVRRILIHLISLTYHRVYVDGRRKIELSDLDAAYEADAFAGLRNEVKASNKIFAKRNKRYLHVRRDSDTAEMDDEVDPVAQRHRRKLNEAVQFDALSASEKKALNKRRQAVGAQVLPENPANERKPRQVRPSDDELNKSPAELKRQLKDSA